MASNVPTQPGPSQPIMSSPAPTASIITALGQALQKPGDPLLTHDRIAQMLLQNMGQLGELAKQGKLNQQQIMQLKEYAEKHKSTIAAQSSAGTSRPTSLAPPHAAYKGTSPTPMLGVTTATSTEAYPISQTLNVQNPGQVAWSTMTQGRPTLTGGTAAGRMSSTPAQTKSTLDETFTPDDATSRRKNTPADQSMRRSIQDLVSSIDPNVKIEPEVEDLLLDVADEFIDSVTNFGCRLAKHRGGDTLEVRDLQLHLERNHNIRIPGFASDETRISVAQSGIAPAAPAPGAKKAAQGTQMSLRSHRLAQVQQVKREAKLI
ncbi:hypothetical protein EWM64_g3114 [Hericium alpestre]|uniref:TBP-associated factor 12 n=1 Tax=Hericium alpestre TaxID=135208 RepID=A0A4Z0A5D1_9AGAM|nr:hypothetical protein EWM64_g3114 [Hericium alpestre]